MADLSDNDSRRQLAETCGLEGQKLDTYIKFMEKKFPHLTNEKYLKDWAQRFKDGTEWSIADTESKKILIQIDENYWKNVEMKN